jgi:hypothetical protein
MGTMFLADGPTRYFGGSIMTFALPYAAFMVSPAHQTSAGTREPGRAGIITFRSKPKPSTPMPADPTAESEQ